ncbi:uncharacterized protein N0V89_007696 [Didymosphaeria variabile]|uniref:Uncharacterized protein n=1 Tax=Didymosphaeria variabile TaxID=1932322 RepID=A0A9W8XJC4_9PLEO|nr:uncharacterized protein N0V89_007696 [Didymosphaeria variabile]KAJ4352348.1 hypothetical protein N0V89_007696 [Didymosphaeria variabile]
MTLCSCSYSHYLVYDPLSRRPYYTSIPWLAADFKRWGYRVDEYAEKSLWIKQHFKKPQRVRPLLLWAAEVLRRDETDREDTEGEGEEAGGEDEVGRVLADFMRGLARSGEYDYYWSSYRAKRRNTALRLPIPQIPLSSPHHTRLAYLGYRIPPSASAALSFYISLIGPLQIIHNARKPRMSPYDHGPLERLTLRIGPHRYRNKEHLYEAMKFAVEARPGRMGELRDRTAWTDIDEHGVMIVRLWVRAEDEDGIHAYEAEAVEELPLYESEEEDLEGELPPSYDEVMVKEPA